MLQHARICDADSMTHSRKVECDTTMSFVCEQWGMATHMPFLCLSGVHDAVCSEGEVHVTLN